MICTILTGLMGILILSCFPTAAAAGSTRDSIAYGQTLSADLSVAGEQDSYTFSAGAGDVILIRMAEVSSLLEPLIRLYDPSDILITSTWDYSMAEIGVAALATSGIHTVLAMDHPGIDTGEYTIRVLAPSTPVPDTPVEPLLFALHPNHHDQLRPARGAAGQAGHLRPRRPSGGDLGKRADVTRPTQGDLGRQGHRGSDGRLGRLSVLPGSRTPL